MSADTLSVVVATPLGQGGKGGIDRIMDEVRHAIADMDREELDCTFLVTRGQWGKALSPLRLALAMAELVGRWALKRPDLVHINLSSHGSTDRKIVLAQLCRVLGIPYLIHLHGSRMRQYWLASSDAQKRRINAMFSGAARILVLGEVWRQFVAEQVPEAKDRIVIFPNASARVDFSPTHSEVVRILFLGRLGERKGVPDLVKALAALPRDGQWVATIAGDGEIQETLAQVSALGLADKVTVPGWVGPKEVRHHLANSDILVLPSYDENLPMSVIEGMAAGLAVVATPVGATEEIVLHGETGLLVKPGDVDGLASALTTLIADRALRERLGATAKQFHEERLEIGAFTSRLIQLWRDVKQEMRKNAPRSV